MSLIIENTEIIQTTSIPVFNAGELSSVPVEQSASMPNEGDRLVYDSIAGSWVTSQVYSITGPTGATGPSNVVNNTSQTISFCDTTFTNTRNSYMVSVLKNSNISDENLKNFCRTTNSTLSKTSYSFGVNEQNTKWISVGESATGANASIAYSIDGVSWNSLSSSTGVLSTGNDLDWDGNVWVAVGTPGTTTNSSIVFSRNGLDWQSSTGSVDIFNYEVRSVKTDGDRWVAVGSTGATDNICYSDDGIVWKPCTINDPTTNLSIEPYSIGYNGTYWVITGERLTPFASPPIDQSFYVSNNGINFNAEPVIMTQLDSSVDSPKRINSVCWNGNFWVYGASSETTTSVPGGAIVWITDPGLYPYSTSLIPVTSDKGSNLEIKNISWNGKMFIASGNHVTTPDSNKYMYSYNGLNWSLDSSSIKIFGKILNTFWDGTKWLGVGIAGPGNITDGGANTTGYSYNGLDWYGVESSPASTTFPSITFTSLLFNKCNSVRRNTEYKNKLLFTPTQLFLLSKNTSGYGSFIGNGTLTGSTNDNIVTNWSITGMAANDACWNGNKWVIVCDSNTNVNNGAIYYSRSPLSAIYAIYDPTVLWKNTGSSIFSISGNGVTWDGEKFIAVGEGTNTIAYSYDAMIWVPVIQNNLIFTSGKKIYFNEKLYIAVGTGNYSIAYSTDGINWNGVINSNTIFTTANNVIFNGTIWLAVGEGTNTIAYSNDGINWNGLGTTIFSNSCFDLDYNNDLLLAVGEGTNTIAYSYDGISWVGEGTSTFTTRGNSIVWHEDKWVAVGDNGGTKVLYFSYDGMSWINEPSSSLSNNKSYIAKNNPTVGYLVFPQPCLSLGYLYNGNSISYSNDGIFWSAVGTKIFNAAYNASWNGNMWIAVGSGENTLAYSYNGIDWIGLGKTLFSEGRCVAWNGTMWVAGGAGTNPVHTIAYSYDGINWTGLGKDVITEGGYGLTWTGKSWIMVGTGEYQIAKSFNGITWVPITANTPFDGGYSKGVCCANGIVVAVGTGQTNVQISYSLDDGNTWIASTTPNVFGNFGNAVAWNGEVFVAVGGETKNIAYSYDGISWTAVSTNFFGSGPGASGNGVGWTGERWVVVGSNINSNPIIYSNDGVDWYKSQVNPNLMTIGYGVGVNPKAGTATYIPNKRYLSIGQQIVFNSPDYYDRGLTAPTDITILLSES
jgi:hypothetical protein